jgi:uridylate kinase
MKNKKWVISLGGSRITPECDLVDSEFIKKFHNIVSKHPSKKFVVVTGGGTTARKYIKGMKHLNKKTRIQNQAGIAVTRFHASYLSRIFGKKANSPEETPKSMKKVTNLLNKNQVVFCGGLRYQSNNTSDGTSAQLAAHLKCPFINITNIKGLYTANPKTNKNAKYISKITWKKFNDIAKRIKFKAGQHFVLDQTASKIIMKKKIPTYIIGSLAQLDNILSGKKFVGTIIEG